MAGDEAQEIAAKEPEDFSIKEGNISLIMDSYDDIFSDFDPKSYSEKALSDDFLVECKKAARVKSNEGLELRLLVPSTKRDEQIEQMIKKRLKNHFQRHYHENQREIRRIKLHGVKFFIGGVICMMIAAFLYSRTEEGIFSLHDTDFLFNVLIVIFEPAAWFLFWEGLDMIFFGPKDKHPEWSFYKKMANVKIEFYSY